MSSTQKKPDNTKRAASGKAPGKPAKRATAKSSSAKKGTSARKKPAAYTPDLVSRGIAAAVCVFLALLVTLGMFGIHAVVPDLLKKGIQGLIGYGFWMVAFVLLWAAGLLLFRRDRRQTLRLWCLGLLPVVGGALLHILLWPGAYPIDLHLVGRLWTDGVQSMGGGVVSGFLAVVTVKGISRLAAGLVFALLFVILLALAAHVTRGQVSGAVSRARDHHAQRAARREKYADYDDEDEYEDEYDDYDDEDWDEDPDPAPYAAREARCPAPRPAVSLWPFPRRKRAADVPLDDPEKLQAKRDEAKAQRRSHRAQSKPSARSLRPDEGELLPADTLFHRETGAAAQQEPELAPADDLQPDAPMTEAGDAPIWQPLEGSPSPTVAPAATAANPAGSPGVAAGAAGAVAGAAVGAAAMAMAEAKPQSKAQRQAEIHQEAAAVGQSIQETLDQEEREYVFPSLDLLAAPSREGNQAAKEELDDTLSRLAETLRSFGINGRVIGAVQGPSVTRYDVSLEQGVRLNKLTNLADDVALALGASSVRIAPVPGKISVVGVEVPNQIVTPVPIREVLESPNFQRHKSSVAFSVGKDIGGNYIVGDCSKLPHMLIAGTTGSGKSVCINSLLISMLYKSTPQELRLIMVDPKMVELGGYNGIPHLLIPVVTDPKKAAGALQWAVTEMMKRYRMFAEAGVRDLAGYNHWAQGQEGLEPLPKVVIVIDELADLMLVAAKEVEESICRVAQMGRASGMHLVIATQRPSADVITGLMKANIPSRVAFAVASSLESRIILDTTGAEKLVGKGDMLWFPLGAGKPLRVQGCFISDEEVAEVVASVKQNAAADYDDQVMAEIEQHAANADKKGKSSGAAGAYPGGEEDGEEQDERFEDGVEAILEVGQASVSMLQRRLKLGYARAARLMDQIEAKGIVGPSEGAKPRQILITKDQWRQMQSGQPLGEEPLPAEDPLPPVEEEILTFDPVPQDFLE